MSAVGSGTTVSWPVVNRWELFQTNPESRPGRSSTSNFPDRLSGLKSRMSNVSPIVGTNPSITDT